MPTSTEIRQLEIFRTRLKDDYVMVTQTVTQLAHFADSTGLNTPLFEVFKELASARHGLQDAESRLREYLERVMAAPIEVQVLTKHIHPARSRGAYCPIERALLEQVEWAGHVAVGYETATVGPVTWWLPDEAKAFIREYDAGRQVLPFTFTLSEAL